MDSESRPEIVASFSQDATKFAFQANIAHRNVIDLYPLDPSTGYEINSSFVNQVGYENTEFNVKDLLFLNWCKSEVENKQAKRKLNDEEDDKSIKTQVENFFINAFPKGQLVIYSSNGKDIVNIIKNKQEIIGMDTVGKNIWTLDSNKVVKIFDYNVNKPLKTFTLIDGKKDEITNFQVCQVKNGKNKEEVLIIIITEDHIYIVDPSKRRPTTRVSFELFGGITAQISPDGKYIAIVDVEKVAVYDVESQDFIRSWDLQVERVKIFNDYIFALSTEGQLNVCKLDQDDVISTIKVANSEVLDFTQVDKNVLIAWLNVNEPNFKLFSIEDIESNKEIIINEEDTTEINVESINTKDDDIEEDDGEEHKDKSKPKKKKVTKKEQNVVVTQLIALLESNGGAKDIIANITSASTWNESRITYFITHQVTNDNLATLLLKCITDELQSKVWEETTLLNTWMKWLLILTNVPNGFKYDKGNKKTLKHFKSSLKTSSESLPILLGIQGRLEMLTRQAALREELSHMALEDSKDTEEAPEGDLIEEGEAQNDSAANVDDGEEDIALVNGESDVFVDAQE